MTDYTVDANWTAKDSAATGSADKVIRGVEFQTEFDLIASAIATKFDSSSAVDINSGAIDNTTIGASTAASGTFTNLTATTADINAGTLDNVTIGGTTAGAGTFTNLTATGTVTLASPILNTAVSGTAVLDEDDMASDSATKLATQQSIKAYVDTEVSSVSVAGITSTATSTQIAISDSITNFTNDITVNGLTVGRGLGSGSSSVALGDNALASSTTGSNNTAIGEYALANVTTGLSNTAIGAYSGLSNISGSFNVSVGHASYSYGTGSYNTAVGYNSMSGSVTGNGNAGCGYNTLNDLTSGVGNSAFGTEALPKVTTGNYNVAVGSNAGNDLTTANDNVLVGYLAGQNLTTSIQNVAIGRQALNTSVSAYGENTCVGYKSLYAVTSGQGNTAMGWSALDDLTTGVANTGIGFNCGIGLTTGGNNTVIGFEATPSSASVSDQITLGDANISSLRCNVTSITSLSDMRDKTNIADLSGASNFIKNLEPVSFDWARRDNTMQGVQSHGFLAQQLQSAQDSTGYQVPGLVFDDNPDKLEASYGNLLPTIVAALKDALTEIDELKAKVAALESA